jgi:hypothetical protein
VRDLLNRINAPELQAAKQQVRGLRGGCQPGGRGHNQRGRGHPNNHGRNQGRGHGERGRGGRGGNQNLGYYTEEEWSALTREQKDSILEARVTKRNVASVETDDSQQNPPAAMILVIT